MKKTFLLGLGAQKAGTTWVYRYLKDHPECEMGSIKEKTVLSAYFGSHDSTTRTLKKIEALQEELKKYQWRKKRKNDNPKRDQYLMDMMDNLSAELDLRYYLTYFDRICQANPDAKLVGEITPEYSTLTAENLAEIKAMLESAGYDVKVVFLMRDPIERCYSAMRMGARQDARAGVERAEGPHNNFAKYAVMDWCQIRTRYERVIPAIEKVFAPEDRLIEVYETFFTAEKVRGLCDFLGISYMDAKVDSKVNTSPRDEEPSDEQLSEVRKFYDPTYRFVAQWLGEEHLAKIWPNYGQPF
jgi:sulfotransferase family protein